jgi:hypothetical protein
MKIEQSHYLCRYPNSSVVPLALGGWGVFPGVTDSLHSPPPPGSYSTMASPFVVRQHHRTS